jgi:CRISPR-associated protein Cas5t
MKAAHIRLEGISAFFRYTTIISGNQLTLPCPTYANILGLISAVTDKIVMPRDTRIGYEFNSASTAEDLERTQRLELDRGSGILKPHSAGRGILRRQVHFMPTLDLYLTNLDLAEAFRNPVAIPVLGRSQDICWITKVEEVELTSVESGLIGSTLLNSDFVNESIPADIVRATEYFTNDNTGYTRTAGAIGYYLAIRPEDARIQITMSNLYHPSNLPTGDAIYLHEWSAAR